jgi:cytosine/adenosine deaminase-related metal-dependent hydrolase
MTSAAASLLAMAVRLVHADHVLPGDAPPIADGAVVVAEDGSIVDVGRATEILPRHAGIEVERHRAIVFPGLVNAHTHIELSSMRGKVPGGRGFVPWVEGLIASRLETTAEDTSSAIDSAVDELVACATVAVGDITNSLAPVKPLALRGIAGCIFHEVFGQEREALFRRIHGLREEVDTVVPQWPSRELAYAPAPHTLYTTHADAVAALLDGARKRNLRTSLHLAEHADERQAVEQGSGTVAQWYVEKMKHRPDWPKRPLFDHAAALGALAENVLLVHLTVARDDELARVAQSKAPVVLCPRSNYHIEKLLPPLAAVREAGIEPALGTDSLASNASLDVLAEAQLLHVMDGSIPAWELFRMATWNGARALGRTDLGRLSRGSRPGIYAVHVTDRNAGDPVELLFANLEQPRRAIVSRTSGALS